MSATESVAICTFDEERHEYRRDGIVLPSVTRIIEAVIPRSDGASDDAIEKARLRGTWVDAKLMEYLTHGTCTFHPEDIPQEWQICLDYAIEWCDQNISKAECQVRLFGADFAGTADLVADEVLLIDLKSTFDIGKTVQAQLGAYAELLEEDRGIRVRRIGVLHALWKPSKPMKAATFKEYIVDECQSDWRLIRDLWRRFLKKRR